MNVDYSAYEGFRVRGYTETVLSRGRVVVDNGEYVGQPGNGQFIRRGPYGRAYAPMADAESGAGVVLSVGVRCRRALGTLGVAQAAPRVRGRSQSGMRVLSDVVRCRGAARP